MKLTANVALLTLLRSGFILKICDFDDAPIIKKKAFYESKKWSIELMANRPKHKTSNYFPFTRQGLKDALKWASEGYVTWTQDVKEMSK